MADYSIRQPAPTVAAENPFAKFVAPQGTMVEENPFARFVEQQRAIELEPQAPEQEPEPWEVIDYDQPKNVVRQAIRGLTKEQRKEATRAWQKALVAKERAQARETTLGRIGLGVSDTIGQFSRGIPVIGGALDEMDAATSAVLATFSGGQNDTIGFDQQVYDEQLAYNRARDQAADAEATKLGEAPLIGDVTMGGVTKLAGGIASAPVTPIARVFQGGAMLPQMANIGLTGAALGAGHGYADAEGEDRSMGAAYGGGLGAALGGLAVPAARGIGNAASYVSSQAARLPAELRQFAPGSVRRVAEALDADVQGGSVNPAAATVLRNGRAVQLGDDAMLADLGDNLALDADAIANRPGAGQRVIRDALNSRRAGAADRITSDVDTALGRPDNIPLMIDQTQRTARQQASPLYDDFYSRNVDVTPTLRDIVGRANATGAVREAQRLMAQAGYDPRTLTQLIDEPMTPLTGVQSQRATRIPNGLELDYIKRAIDDMARRAGRGTNEHRILSGLARDLRNEVDTILSPQDPSQSVWAQARSISGDDFSFREAVEQGQRAFTKGLSPDQMERDLATMGPLQQDAYRRGARDQVRQVMGNSGTTFSATGDTAARRALGSDNARQKVALIADGQRRVTPNGLTFDQTPNADRLTNRLDAESVFEGTRQRVTGNSSTAERLAAQERYPSPVAGDRRAANLRPVGLTGLVLEGASRMFNALSSGARNEAAMRIAEDSARMLVAQGATRQQILTGLNQYMARQRVSQGQRRRIQGLVRDILQGARQPLIDGEAQEIAQ